MLSFIKTPKDVMLSLRDRFKSRRLMLGFTQKELSDRSGVSLGSLKRFEKSGQISLESLLKLGLILECLDDFESISQKREQPNSTLDEILQTKEVKLPKRGRLK